MIKKFGILSLLLLSLVACKDKKEEIKEEINKKPVKTIIVEELEVNKKISLASNLKAYLEVEHITKGGTIKEIHAKNGQRVEEGDLIIKLENDDVESSYLSAKANYLSAKSTYENTKKFAQLEVFNNLKQAKANYTSAKENLAKASRGGNQEERNIAQSNFEASQIAFEEAESNLKKYKELFIEGLISEDEYRRVDTAYNQSLAQFNQAKNNLELVKRGADTEDINILNANYESTAKLLEIAQKNVDEKTWEHNIQLVKSQFLSAEAQYNLAKIKYDDLEVRAKISGIVANLNNKVFDEIQEDINLFNILDDKKMEIEMGVNSQDLQYLEIGNKVLITSRDFKGKKEGVITEINPIAHAQDRTFTLKALISNENEGLKSGMYANVLIEGISQNVLLVPKESVLIRGLNKYIFTVKNDTAERITVHLGSEYDDKVEITEGNLKFGDRLVVEGQYLLENQDYIEEVK